MKKERYYYCNRCGATVGIKDKKKRSCPKCKFTPEIKKEQLVLCRGCKKWGHSSVMKEVFVEEQPVFPLRYNRYKRSYTAQCIHSKEKVEVHRKGMKIVLRECQEYLIKDLKKEFPLYDKGKIEDYIKSELYYTHGGCYRSDDFPYYYGRIEEKESKNLIDEFTIEGAPFVQFRLCWAGYELISCNYGILLDDAISFAKQQLKKLIKDKHDFETRKETYRQLPWWHKLGMFVWEVAFPFLFVLSVLILIYYLNLE